MPNSQLMNNYYSWHPAPITFRDFTDEIEELNLVLDVGCGNNWINDRIRKLSNTIIIGIDLNPEAFLENKIGNQIVGTIERLPFGDCVFDGIVAKDILEHLLYPKRAMGEINRVLQLGGILIATVPDMKAKTFWDDYTHIRPFSKTSLTNLLTDSGFVILDIFYTANIPGLGILMRILKISKTPKIIKYFNNFGAFRQNIFVIARKE